MPEVHECHNDCGEDCNCGNGRDECTYCSSCVTDVPDSSQCDYCTNRATYECPGCSDLFWCADHEDAKDDGCDACRCMDCGTYPCECECEDDDDADADEQFDDEE